MTAAGAVVPAGVGRVGGTSAGVTLGRQRRLGRHIAAFFIFVLLAGLPAPALAHAHLQRTAPSAGARLATAPSELRLTFSEAPALAVSSVRLVGPDGAAVPLGGLAAASGAPRVVVVPIRGALGAGAYMVTWQIVADDGHPTRGQFTFTIGPAAAGVAARAAVSGHADRERIASTVIPPAASTPHAGSRAPGTLPAGTAPGATAFPGTGFGAESPLYAAVRWLQYVGLLAVLGAVAFRTVVLRFVAGARPATAALVPVLRAGVARLGLGATVVVAVSAVLRLVAQLSTLRGVVQGAGGAGPGSGDALLGAMLLHTVWGAGWCVQVAGVLLAAAGFAAARRPQAASTAWALATLGTAALAVSPGLSGHAASAPRWTALTVVADVTHIVGAGGWLGSLLVLVIVGIPAALRLDADARGPAVADLVSAFSPTALGFAGVVALTGVFATWVHVGSVPALWRTAYGRTLLVKLALLAAVAAVGAYNWRRVRPALAHPTTSGTGAARLRRSATLELLVGLLVLAATAVLVATPTAVDLRAPQDVSR